MKLNTKAFRRIFWGVFVLTGMAYWIYEANYWSSEGSIGIFEERSGFTTESMPTTYKKAMKQVESELLSLGFERIEKNPLGYKDQLVPGVPVEIRYYRGRYEGSRNFVVVSQLTTDGNPSAQVHAFEVYAIWNFRGFRPLVSRSTKKVKRFLYDFESWWETAKDKKTEQATPSGAPVR